LLFKISQTKDRQINWYTIQGRIQNVPL